MAFWNTVKIYQEALEVVLTPRAKGSKNILNVRAVYVLLVIAYFSATPLRPGAIIELASGGTKVYSDTYKSLL